VKLDSHGLLEFPLLRAKSLLVYAALLRRVLAGLASEPSGANFRTPTGPYPNSTTAARLEVPAGIASGDRGASFCLSPRR